MKKTFKIVVILMVIVLSVSSLSLMIDVFSGRSDSDIENPIIPSDTFVADIKLPSSPDYESFYDDVPIVYEGTDDKDLGYLSVVDNYIYYDGVSKFSFSDNSLRPYATVYLYDPSRLGYEEPIDMRSYSYLKVEFDILYDNIDQQNKCLLGCVIYPMIRGNGYMANPSVHSVFIHNDKTVEDVKVHVGNKKVYYYSNPLHVEYIIEIDKDNLKNSRMQTFIDGELASDNYGSSLFTKDVYNLTELRITNFNSESSESSVGFDNLRISYYK